MLPREANFRSVVKIARATDEPCLGDPIETYGDARRDALLWADDEIERLRLELDNAREKIKRLTSVSIGGVADDEMDW